MTACAIFEYEGKYRQQQPGTEICCKHNLFNLHSSAEKSKCRTHKVTRHRENERNRPFKFPSALFQRRNHRAQRIRNNRQKAERKNSLRIVKPVCKRSVTHCNIKNRCEKSRKYRRHGYNPYNFGSAQLSLADRPSGFCGQVKFVFIESAVPTLKMIRSEILHVSADSFRFSFSVPASSVYVGLRQVSLLCFAVYFVSYSPPKCTLLHAYEILRCRFPPVEFKNPHSTVSRVCFFVYFC